MTRKYLPFELILRMPERKHLRYISDYHAICTQKYDWLVKPREGAVYYINGERPQLSAGDTVFDCNWMPEQWHSRPYKAYIHEGNGSLYEHYARYGLEPLAVYSYGWKREDSLITKDGEAVYYGLFRHNAGNISAHWWLDRDDVWIIYNSSYTYYYGMSDIHSQGETFSTVTDVKKPMIEPVMKAARALNTAKYKGVYKPFIDRLVELYGLNETQI